MKNILIFTKEYQHEKLSHCGGTGIFYRNLAEKLSQNGYNVSVFCFDNKPVEFVENRIRVCSVQGYFKKNFIEKQLCSITRRMGITSYEQKIYEKSIFYYTKQLKQFIEKNDLQIDIIETHDWEGVSLFLSDLKIPYVVRCHGGWIILEKYFNYKADFRKKQAEIKAFSKAQNIVFISDYNKKIYTETLDISGTLIRNGVDVSYFSPSDENVIPRSIFFFGNATSEKGFDIALSSFYSILEHYPDASLHIIGRYNEKVKHSNIHYYGFLQGERLLNTLRQADIFIFPSKGETFGLAICEAMAMGKVVVASDIPSFNNFINSGQNGFICKNQNDYVNAILQLFDNEEDKNRIGKNAREFMIENYNFEKTFQETINFYKSCI